MGIFDRFRDDIKSDTAGEKAPVTFSDAGDLDDVLKRLKRAQTITGSQETLLDTEIRLLISRVLKARERSAETVEIEERLREIPRTAGLREAVARVAFPKERKIAGEPKELIAGAGKLDRLIEIIEDLGVIHTDDGLLTAREILKSITEAEAGFAAFRAEDIQHTVRGPERHAFSNVTRTLGLRDAVRRLIGGEEYVKKYQRELGTSEHT